jgi:PAS domain S-box-containing protein
MSIPVRNPLVRYAVAPVVVALAMLLRWALRSVLGPETPYIIFFFPAVMTVAWCAGAGPGLLATALSAAAVQLSLRERAEQLGAIALEPLLGQVVFVLSGVFISLLGGNLHRAVARAQQLAATRAAERERFRAALAGIADGVLLTDEAGHVTLLNSAARSLTGWGEEAIGRPLEDVFQAVAVETGEALGEPAEGVLTTGLSFHGRGPAVLTTRAGNTLLIEWKAGPVRVGGGIEGAVLIFRDVTARRRAETQLRERAEEIETLMEVLPIGVFVALDPACSHVTANRAGYTMLGLPAGTNLSATPPSGKKSRVRFFRDHRELVPAELPLQFAAAHGTEVRDVELDFVVDGRETVSSFGHAAPLFDAAGQVRGCVGVFLDMTERRRLERDLRDSRELFRAFMDNGPAIAFIKDEKSRYLYVNRIAEETFGRPGAEWIGRSDAELFPADLAAPSLANDQTVLESRRAMRFAELTPGPGGVRHYLAFKFPLQDAAGRTVVGGLSIDITERTQTEDALRASEERLRSVVDTVVDGIITIDGHGIVQTFNPAAERIFGYRADQVIGQNVKLLMPDPYQGEQDSYFVNYRRTGVPKIIGIGREVMGRRRDGSTFPMDLAVGEFQLHDRSYFTGIIRDVTQRKQAEEALREADRRKDNFLATLAHELRNPLAPIRNSLEILRLNGQDASTAVQALDMMDRQIAQMVRLIDDLLDLSRISRGRVELRKERADVAGVVRMAVETSRPLLESAGHQLTVTLPNEPVLLHADPTRLAQVLANLLNNAAKYTDPGGRVELTAALEKSGSQVVLRVRDTGMGIPADMLPRVFEPFLQIGPSRMRSQGGLGIGLALVKSYVEMHGGSVEAISPGPGQGSEFIVRLPLAPDTDAQHTVGDDQRKEAIPNGGFFSAAPKVDMPCTAEETSPEAVPTALKRILVIDDNKDAAESLAAVLRLLGFEVRTAHDGATGLEAAADFTPEVVLLDLGMPGLSGYDVARRLRGQPQFANVLVIALTGWGADEDRRRTRAAGFDHHLVKPIDPETLIELLGGIRFAS